MSDEPPRSSFEDRTFGLMSLGMALCTALAVGLVALGARPVWLIVIPMAIFGAVVGLTLEFCWPAVPQTDSQNEPDPPTTATSDSTSQLECLDCGEAFQLNPQRCPMCGGNTTSVVAERAKR